MPANKKAPQKTNDLDENKILAAVSYLWIASIVVLMLKRDNEFVQFHAKQGLMLFITSVILMFIPMLGWFLNLVVFAFVIIGFVKAITGEKWQLPILGEFAKKINL